MARIPAQISSDDAVQYKFRSLKIHQSIVEAFKTNVALPQDSDISDLELGQLFSFTSFCLLLTSTVRLSDFLVGCTMSIRDSYPMSTASLFGPLNNNAVLRVNMSDCTSFLDLMLVVHAEWRQSRQRAHFPFSEVGLEHGLDKIPIQVRVATYVCDTSKD